MFIIIYPSQDFQL